jgi:hypothetical protein
MLDQSLEYFIDKVVTVFTSKINKNFTNDDIGLYQFSQYFVGKVIQVDSTGVWLYHQQTDKRSFFNLNWIVGICEEEVVDESHPSVQEAKKYIEQKRAMTAAMAEEESQPQHGCCGGGHHHHTDEPEMVELSMEKLTKIVNKS